MNERTKHRDVRVHQLLLYVTLTADALLYRRRAGLSWNGLTPPMHGTVKDRGGASSASRPTCYTKHYR